jgi:hypothetical protein
VLHHSNPSAPNLIGSSETSTRHVAQPLIFCDPTQSIFVTSSPSKIRRFALQNPTPHLPSTHSIFETCRAVTTFQNPWPLIDSPDSSPMSRSPLRPASAPHTNKPPDACPYCGSRAITRKGVRKKKLEVVQLWRCGSCKRLFTPGPAALRNKTYPIRVVLQALTLYNLGYTLGETAKRLKSKAGRAVSPTTIATWIGAHKEQTTFRRLRAEAKTIYPPTQTIRSIKLYHRQVYAYAYHRSKLTLLRRNPQHQRFEALATFLETIPSSCPHELFRREEDPKARASQAQPAFAPRSAKIPTSGQIATGRDTSRPAATGRDRARQGAQLRHEPCAF